MSDMYSVSLRMPRMFRFIPFGSVSGYVAGDCVCASVCEEILCNTAAAAAAERKRGNICSTFIETLLLQAIQIHRAQ